MEKTFLQPWVEPFKISFIYLVLTEVAQVTDRAGVTTHQSGARGHQVARKEQVGRPRPVLKLTLP